MEYEKMFIYNFNNVKKIDNNIESAIFLTSFLENSLIWCGTTVKRPEIYDEPFIIILDKKEIYFYDCKLFQIPSENLASLWKNPTTDEPYKLTDDEQKRLISKFSNFTNQKDPYKVISELELANQKIKAEIQFLKQEKEIQKEKELLIEEELEEEYELG